MEKEEKIYYMIKNGNICRKGFRFHTGNALRKQEHPEELKAGAAQPKPDFRSRVGAWSHKEEV